MKKRHNNSVYASALQVSISVVLMAISAILFASSFMAAPAGQSNVSGTSQQDGFYPPLPVSGPAQQDGFYPPLPATAPAQPTGFYPPLPGGVGVTVSLPIDTMDTSVPISTVIIKPVLTSNIDPSLNYVGFQGDFTFDSTVFTFSSPPARIAGLTSGNWNATGNVLPTPTPGASVTPSSIRTLRISAFSNDFTPLSGSGTLFEMRMLR